MATDPKALYRQITDVGLGAAKSLDSDQAVSFVKTLISSMDKTIKAIDKYLKKAKDGLEKGYDIAKEKGKLGFGATVNKLKDLTASVKEKGLKGALTAETATITGKLSKMFSSDTERANGPPDGEPLTPMQQVGKIFGSVKDKANKLADDAKASGPFTALIAAVSELKTSIVTLTQTNEESNEIAKSETSDASTSETQDGEGKPSLLRRMAGGVRKRLNRGKGSADPDAPKKPSRFWDSFKRSQERMSLRRNEIDAEKAGAQTKGKGKGKGPFSAIISAIMTVGGLFTSGIGSLLTRLPGLMLSGMGSMITRLLPSIASTLGPMFAGGIGAGLKTAALTAGKFALGAVTSGAGAVAGAVLSPIGLGIIAGAAALYGGYRLYKYLNRNSLGGGIAGKLTRLRMLSYGYSDVNRDHYNKLLDLDMLMENYVSAKEGRAVYKKFDSDFKTKTMEIFGVTREEKEKYQLLNTWFVKRYVPAHATFMHSYYGAGGRDYLDDLDKLSGNQMFKLAVSYRLPLDMFDHKTIPIFENPTSTVTKDEIDIMLNAIKQEAKTASDEGKGRTIEEEKAIADARLKTEAAVKKAAAEKLKAAAVPKQDPYDKKFSNASVPSAGAAGSAGVPDAYDKKFTNKQAPLTGIEEGEKPPPASSEKPGAEEKPLQSSVDKVSKAPGPLSTGGPELIGIKSRVATEKIHNLDPNVLNLLTGMTKEYNELTGKSITVNEAFRSYADQAALKRSKGAAAAAPGSSLHEFGIAVDINSNDADTLDKMGLMRKYGFTRPVGGETWHVEPAGVSLNPRGSKSDPDERLKNILSSPGRGGGGLGAQRGLPSSMKYKRDMALQKTLFNSGTSIESPVEIAEMKKEADVATGPLVDKKPVKDPAIDNKSKAATAFEPPKTTQAKAEGLDTPKPPASLEGPQMSKALYKPPATEKSQVFSDYSEGEKPPKDGADQATEQSYANLPPREAIKKAAEVVGVNHEKLLAFAKMESSLRPGVKASTSSATGLFQITGGTWKMLLKEHGPKYNIPPDAEPSNAYYNSVLGAVYAKENIKTMDKFEDSGIRQDVLIYLAHHFGPSGGTRIVRAYMRNPDSSMVMAVSDDAYKANIQSLRGKTVRQYVDSLTAKLNKAGSTGNVAAGSTGDVSPADNKPLPVKDMTTKRPPVLVDPVDKAYPVTITQKTNAPSFEGTEDTSNGSFGNPPKGFKDNTSSLSKGIKPIPMTDTSRQVVPQQPSAAMSLDKTESLLTNMGDTLSQIKTILQSIHDKSSMTPTQAPAQKAEASAPIKSQEPIRAPNYNIPSTEGVNMSRRSVLT